MKKLAPLASMFILLWSSLASSHVAWLVPIENKIPHTRKYQVYFGGHEDKLQSYPAEKVKVVSAVSKNGAQLNVWRTMDDDKVQIRVDGNPAMIMLHFENGIYTRSANGKLVNMPMNLVDDPLSAVNAVKYHKTISTWSSIVTKPQGQPFEIVPISGNAPTAGEVMQVQVLIFGEPAEGVNVGTSESSAEVKTDAKGLANFIPKKGLNRLWAGKRTNESNSLLYNELSIEYLMTFTTK
jgi:nickel transport protein